MTNNESLDKIANSLTNITEKQQNSDIAQEGEEFNTEEYKRNKEDYDGSW